MEIKFLSLYGKQNKSVSFSSLRLSWNSSPELGHSRSSESRTVQRHSVSPFVSHARSSESRKDTDTFTLLEK